MLGQKRSSALASSLVAASFCLLLPSSAWGIAVDGLGPWSLYTSPSPVASSEWSLEDPESVGQIGVSPPRFTSRDILGTPAPHGSDVSCLHALAAEGAQYREAARTEGIATPVTVVGDRFGGVYYRYFYDDRAAHKPRVVDCRLALALVRAGPVLRNIGVTEVIFVSSYRPSLGLVAPGGYHAHHQGLALDVRGFRVGNKRLHLDVPEDYELGLGFMDPADCVGRPLTMRGMLLRKIACDLDAADLFSAILTPDYDAQHWHHFHWSVFHPREAVRLRPRRTALAEVPIDDIPAWAFGLPLQHDPSARRWDGVATSVWPARFRWVRARLGLPEPLRANLEKHFLPAEPLPVSSGLDALMESD